jgi:hypothetical protein
VSDELLRNRALVTAACRQNSSALQFAPAELQDDVEVVIECVAQSAESLRFASARLQGMRTPRLSSRVAGRVPRDDGAGLGGGDEASLRAVVGSRLAQHRAFAGLLLGLAFADPGARAAAHAAKAAAAAAAKAKATGKARGGGRRGTGGGSSSGGGGWEQPRRLKRRWAGSSSDEGGDDGVGCFDEAGCPLPPEMAACAGQKARCATVRRSERRRSRLAPLGRLGPDTVRRAGLARGGKKVLLRRLLLASA